METAKPQVSDYLDYRSFLQDLFRHLKAVNPAFSMRAFARQPSLSISSSSFMSNLLQGKRNLTQHLRLKFSKALKLEPHEAEYFDFLVQFNQAKSLEEKNYFFSHLSKHRGSRAKLLAQHQYRFFSQWYHTVIWNYFGLEKAEREPSRIAKHLAGVYSAHPATREKGRYYMHRLLELVPSAKLVDMYVSEEIDRIFDKVREEFLARQRSFGGAYFGFGLDGFEPYQQVSRFDLCAFLDRHFDNTAHRIGTDVDGLLRLDFSVSGHGLGQVLPHDKAGLNSNNAAVAYINTVANSCRDHGAHQTGNQYFFPGRHLDLIRMSRRLGSI